MDFQKYSSIENFVSVHHELKKLVFPTERPSVRYKAKIKLHGTNAGIFVSPDGTIKAMKRTGFITPENDNHGFAAFVESIRPALDALSKTINSPWTIFGEWAGKGVQKHDAVSKLEEKHFFIFQLRNENTGDYISEPEHISQVTHPHLAFQRIKIIPWSGAFFVDYSLENSVIGFVDCINKAVDLVNQEDPYIKDQFNISESGEGYVLYPTEISKPCKVKLMFKAKTERHSVDGIKTKAATVDPVMSENAAAFALQFVTEARIDQAIFELFNGDLSNCTLKDLGPYLKWIGQDVHKESQATLIESGLEWSGVAKAVTQLAKNKFCQRLECRSTTLTDSSSLPVLTKSA